MAKKVYKLIVRPPNKMRYLTVGDYYETKNGWEIISADTGNSDYNFLIFVHELIELYLTQRRGIAESKIKKFDEWFEREKAKGRFKNILGPGHHPKAPYQHEHIFAVKIEKLLAKELGVDRKKQGERENRIFEKIRQNLMRHRKHKK